MVSVSGFSRAAEEMAAQWRYQRQLGHHIGAFNAVRARLMGMVDRRLGHRAEIRMHPRSVDYPVMLRVASTDPETYHQVLVQEQYACVADLDAKVIVDCGANAGFTSAYLLSRYPDACVIALEPFPDNAELCRRNLEPYGSRAKVVSAAVWSHSTRLVLEGRGGHEWGVRVRAADHHYEGQVDALGLADLKLPRIDLLKIDIEGSEEIVFSESAQAWLPTVGAIAIELHGPACQRAFDDALQAYEFERFTSGELTVVRNLRKR